MATNNHVLTIIACSALSMVLGTIHAFSVFIPGWESLPGADRASVSLIYSLALVCLTIAVLLGYRLYNRCSPHVLVILVGVFCCAGLALSSVSRSLMWLYVSYGVIFGGANGVGYGYALQLAGQAATSRRGLAMGLVTAFYAVGATLAPLAFSYLIEAGGNALALQGISIVVLAVSVFAAVLLYRCKVQFVGEQQGVVDPLSDEQSRTRLLLWIGYGCAVAAGLMVIGHAFSIATWMKIDSRSAAWAATAVAAGNMLGGFSAGYVADRLSSASLLRWLPLLSAVALLMLVWSGDSSWQIVFVALGMVGYCYGAIIAVYPVIVVDIFGSRPAARIYGQVFTAWGLAGLLGPWISGWLFDVYASYTIALVIAVGLSIASVVVIRKCLARF